MRWAKAGGEGGAIHLELLELGGVGLRLGPGAHQALGDELLLQPGQRRPDRLQLLSQGGDLRAATGRGGEPEEQEANKGHLSV